MRKISISVKLIVLVITTSVIIGFIGIYGIRNLRIVNESLETVYYDRVIPLNQLKIISDMYAVNIVDAAHKIHNGNISWLNGRARIEKARNTIDGEWSAYMETEIIGREKQLVDEAATLMATSNESIDMLQYYLEKEDSTALNQYVLNELYPNIDPITSKISKLMAFQLEIAREKYEEGQGIFTESRQNSILLIVIGVALAVFFSVIIIVSINGSLKKANHLVSELSKGNLMLDFDIKNRDEIGKLLGNLRQMTDKLKSVIRFVQEAADNIASASMQMSSSSQQMSQGSSEQAASAEEVSSSMEQMVANIHQNTENAKQTEKIAIKAASDIKTGSENVNSTVESMREIAKRIGIISDIAYNTNVLALNAAVEAARAGEHGKGFAVVASEVRKLAERSQAAAEEINEMSGSSVQIAEHSGSLLSSIVPQIQNTAQLVQEISAGSTEQNSGVGQINTAVQQLNQVTQQNAAVAEEMATSSEELSSQAENLRNIISFFKIEDQLDLIEKSKNKAPSQSHNSQKKTQAQNLNNGNGVQLDMNNQSDYADSEFERF